MDIIKGKMSRAPKIVIYGPEGVGKSTLAAAMPGVLFIDAEGGTGHLDTDRVAPSTWGDMLKAVKDAAGTEYATIALDTADWAERMCAAHVCQRDKKGGIEEYGYGKGYAYLAEEYVKLLSALDACRDAGKNVIVLAHSQIKKFERPDEAGSYDRYELKCTKTVCPIIKEWSDALLFADYRTIVQTTAEGKAKGIGGRERVLRCSHAAAWDAKNRFGMRDEEPMAPKTLLPFMSNPTATQTHPMPETSTDTRPDKKLSELPRALSQLMARDGVGEEEVRKAVAKRGYYPVDTPIHKYPKSFVDGVLVAAWDKVKAVVEMQVRNQTTA